MVLDSAAAPLVLRAARTSLCGATTAARVPSGRLPLPAALRTPTSGSSSGGRPAQGMGCATTVSPGSLGGRCGRTTATAGTPSPSPSRPPPAGGLGSASTRRSRRSGGRLTRRSDLQKAAGLPFSAPEFRAEKLSFQFQDGCGPEGTAQPARRCYTLTHNDLTGQLFLTVGSQPNAQQISGWYNQLVRDEVLAEWRIDGAGGSALHVHCHVSGEERWLAPPQLRSYIFRREMQLVLDCFVYADQGILSARPEMARAAVFVHFRSHVPALNCCEFWGTLGDRATWRAVPVSLAESLTAQLLVEGTSSDAGSRPPEARPVLEVEVPPEAARPAGPPRSGQPVCSATPSEALKSSAPLLLNNAVPGRISQLRSVEKPTPVAPTLLPVPLVAASTIRQRPQR